MKMNPTYLSPIVSPLKKIAQLATGLSLATGLLSIGLPAQSAVSLESGAQTERQTQAKPNLIAAAPTTLPNGVYLYGQSAEPEQVGKAYFVFEVNQGKVLGAFYMPRSSFDCAYGAFQPGQVALTVIDSYEKTRHPHAIALEKTTAVATRSNPAFSQVSLEGFQRLTKISDNDQRILNTCKQNYPNTLK